METTQLHNELWKMPNGIVTLLGRRSDPFRPTSWLKGLPRAPRGHNA